ncbi:hypothetical protein BH10CHL1_BH10CHL1_00610 [soil metagenome]
MLRFFRDPIYINYSPFSLGCFTTCSLYFGIALMRIPIGVTIPGWLWFLGVPVLITGLAIQFLSRRVLWIRCYQAGTFLLNGAIYNFTMGVSGRSSKRCGASVYGDYCSFDHGGSEVLVFFKNIKRINVTKMSYGSSGLLNPKTGIVDPMRLPAPVQAQWNKAASQSQAWKRWKPLIVGLSMFLVKVLPTAEVDIIMVCLELAWIILYAGAAGDAVAYIAEIMRWERAHQRHICKVSEI